MKNKVAQLGVMLALAMVFSYIESLIPFFFGIPGMKLGLANSLVVMLLYLYSAKDALIVNLLRILLSGLLFGNPFSIIYSLAGGLLSFLVMYLLKKIFGFSPILVSICGAIAHNLGQIIVAVFVMNSIYLFYYFTLLLISGFICGWIMGLVSREVIKYVRIYKRKAD